MDKDLNMGRIYVLRHPITNEIRYCGQTIKTLKYRLNEHIQDSKRRHYHSANWIQSLLKQNLKPLITLVEECDYKDLNSREIYYIKHFRELKINLTNTSNGGQLGSCKFHTEESKQKISNFMKNYKKSLDHIAKMGKTLSKKVYQYSLNGEFIKEFDNSSIASISINKEKTGINNACRREGCCGNFQWRYFKKDLIPAKIMYYKTEAFKERIKITNSTRVLKRNKNNVITNTTY